MARDEMCDHDGTTSGILRRRDGSPGTLEPVLLCAVCGAVATTLAPVEYSCEPMIGDSPPVAATVRAATAR